MTISGNISSTTYLASRAGLPTSMINTQNVELVTDDEIWPCGLVLGRNDAGKYLPYATVTTVIGTGDDAEKDFADEVGPIEPGSASVVAGSVTLSDDSCGRLTGTGGSGAINYETGNVSVSFTSAVADEAAVTLTHKPDPIAVLDAETDTSASASALAVRFGAVKKAELKVGVSAQTAATSAIIRRLDIHHIHAF